MRKHLCNKQDYHWEVRIQVFAHVGIRKRRTCAALRHVHSILIERLTLIRGFKINMHML